MVETGGLENRCTGNRTGGSNPSPSATTQLIQKQLASFTGRPAQPYLAHLEHKWSTIKLRTDEPPVAHPGAAPDSDRAKRPPLPEIPYKPYAEPTPAEAPYEPHKKKPGAQAAYKPYAKKPAESEAPYEPYKDI